MRFGTALSMAKTFTVLGLGAVLVLYVVGYLIIYRKLLKGEKKLPLRRLFWWGCLVCYCFVVLAATVLFRTPSLWRDPVYPLFYSYREAWIRWSLASWRNIILNFCMFLPLGFLFPAGWKRLRSFWKVFALGFGFSLLIECLQLLLKRGMFEPDDLLGNTVGALIGYGCFLLLDQALRRIRKQPLHPGKKVLRAQLPLVISFLAFDAIFLCYQLKPLGVHPDLPLNTLNKKQLHVTSDLTLSSAESRAMVYQSGLYQPAEALALGDEIFAALGTSRRPGRGGLYDDTAFLHSEDGAYSLILHYRGGTFYLSNLKRLSSSGPDGAGTPSTQDDKITEAQLREALQDMGIRLPEPSLGSFEAEGNRRYRFSYDITETEGHVWIGFVECTWENGGLGSVNYQLVSCTPKKEVPLISPQKAFERIVNGKFNYNDSLSGEENPGPKTTVHSLQLTACDLTYVCDSKGYYQPTYEFAGIMDGRATIIRIPAMK